MRLHTEETLDIFESISSQLAVRFQDFVTVTCAAYDTRETAKEQRARLKKEAAVHASANDNLSSEPPANNPTQHSMSVPDFAGPSRLASGLTPGNGPVPGPPEAEAASASFFLDPQAPPPAPPHPSPQSANTTPPVSMQNNSGQKGRIKKRFNLATYKANVAQPFSVRRRTYRSGPGINAHYVIAKTENTYRLLSAFVPCPGNAWDPALKDFNARLRAHLLPRIRESLGRKLQANPLSIGGDPVFDIPAMVDLSCVVLKGHRIFSHQTMRVRYTTYDVRRDEDIVRMEGDKTNIMLLNPHFTGVGEGSEHPFLYAKVIGIYHANATYAGAGVGHLAHERFDFLWVRWYRWQSVGSDSCRHNLLTFLPMDDESAFGFVDPMDIVRGSHILPWFHDGANEDSTGRSAHAQDANEFMTYLVNRFPDRDMYIRYQWGLGYRSPILLWYPRCRCSLRRLASPTSLPLPLFEVDPQDEILGEIDMVYPLSDDSDHWEEDEEEDD
ncbi:hypothetical protein BKA70DRAFT_1445846 [Coprinopsis sp. MPI-PUGE-AT-0042]|nr:hypothetical protein BKA70DRAFT_1445846 [Coprinopsis sp. MPI-PUGE-AT-0042]